MISPSPLFQQWISNIRYNGIWQYYYKAQSITLFLSTSEAEASRIFSRFYWRVTEFIRSLYIMLTIMKELGSSAGTVKCTTWKSVWSRQHVQWIALWTVCKGGKPGTMGNNLHEYLLRYSSALSFAPMIAHSCHKWDRTEADWRQDVGRLPNEYKGAKKGRKKMGKTWK